jgi:hypothetical protein
MESFDECDGTSNRRERVHNVAVLLFQQHVHAYCSKLTLTQASGMVVLTLCAFDASVCCTSGGLIP